MICSKKEDMALRIDIQPPFFERTAEVVEDVRDYRDQESRKEECPENEDEEFDNHIVGFLCDRIHSEKQCEHIFIPILVATIRHQKNNRGKCYCYKSGKVKQLPTFAFRQDSAKLV